MSEATDNSGRRACLVVGVGEGAGSAIARAFALDGFETVMTRRERHLDKLEDYVAQIAAAGGRAHARGVDARLETEMVALFDEIERDIAPLEVVIFNIGANVRFGIRETTSRVFTKVWEMACFSGFITGREAARVMTPRGRGTIIFTGATASLRGSEGYAAFAAAKHGLRAVAQSMARELGPKGIHVAHVVCDGPIDGNFAREHIPEFERQFAEDRVINTDQLARTYLDLHHQHRSAWTHEMDLRPWSEPW